MDNIELDKLPDESKYYIPTIEEFHVGFNYEIWEKKLVYDKVWKFRVNKYIFNEKQVTQTFFNYNFTEDLREGKIRVKLLDKEDIESLSWEFIKQHPGTTNFDFEKESYSLNFDPKFGNKWNLRIYDGEDQDSEFNYFSGYIKNKSELIKLLKQLGIE